MHHRHDAAAALAVVALPRRLLEATRRPRGLRPGDAVLDLLEGDADLVAQPFEPGLLLGFLLFDVHWQTRRDFGAIHAPSPVLLIGGGRGCRAQMTRLFR